MKFHLQTPTSQLVTGLGDDWIRVGTQEYRENVVLTSEEVTTGFAREGFDALVAADFVAIVAQQPEIVLLGTGAVQRFPHPRVLAPLTNARIGVEVMDTRAACRTFNILVAEGRKVAAALFVV